MTNLDETIPMDETIKNAVGDLFSNNMYQGKLYYFLKLATLKSSFRFGNILYKQIRFAFSAYFSKCILMLLRKTLA